MEDGVYIKWDTVWSVVLALVITVMMVSLLWAIISRPEHFMWLAKDCTALGTEGGLPTWKCVGIPK